MKINPKISASLKVEIKSTRMDTSFIPKQIQILGADFSLKESAWLNSNQWNHDFPVGTYLVRLNFSSGTQLENVVELEPQKITNTVFDIDELGSIKTFDWQHLVKNDASFQVQSKKFRNDQKPLFLQNISGRRWQYHQYGWQSSEIATIQNCLITLEKTHYQQATSIQLEMLEIYGPGRESIFCCLPPQNMLEILISPVQDSFSKKTDLDISISSRNFKAQSLLSLISAGDINKARTLVSVIEAEHLLFEKMEDPASAAIGGYYLLKTGEFERMHNWASNLSDWFEWLPDGPILYAWQLIQDQKQIEDEKLDKIRSLFLEAVRRGMPVYTEGLRLLYEGINMLAYEQEHSDKEVNSACALVRKFMDAADMSKDTTTFSGTAPDRPGFSGIYNR